MIMKKLIFILVLIAGSKAKGQDKLLEILPLKDGIVTYSNVIEVEGANKEELFLRAKKWFAKTYKSAQDVIQLDDKESGELIGKGNSSISYYARKPTISHTISISVKDGRFRYVITDLFYSDIQGEKFNIEEFPNSWFGKKKLFEAVDHEVNLIIKSIENGMKSNEEEDW